MFWYLATPYSKYPDGIEAAYVAACRQAALFVRAGIPVFCPIAHTHPIAIHGGIDPLNHEIWLPADEPFMKSAWGLVVCKLPSWEESVGIRHEMDAFQNARKPVLFMEPGQLPSVLCGDKQAHRGLGGGYSHELPRGPIRRTD